MISIRQVALIVLALVVVGSCSSSSSKSTAPSTSPPSSTAAKTAKSQYVATVNALCDTMNTRVSALGTPTSDPTNQADFNDQAIAITTEMLGKIRAVPQPPGDADALNAIYAKVDVVLSDARALSTALRAGDQTAADAAQTKLSTDSQTANDASNAYGLTVCGS